MYQDNKRSRLLEKSMFRVLVHFGHRDASLDGSNEVSMSRHGRIHGRLSTGIKWGRGNGGVFRLDVVFRRTSQGMR
jgi:hypothetical protein